MPAALSHKLRSGVVELRTDIGLVYVSPSKWQRLYFLWTFRHFRLLPKQVLNSRQQELINLLCRSAIVSPPEPVPSKTIIGAIENVTLMPSPTLRPTADGTVPVYTAVVSTVSATESTHTSVSLLSSIPSPSSEARPNRAPADVQPIRPEKTSEAMPEVAEPASASSEPETATTSGHRWVAPVLLTFGALALFAGALYHAASAVSPDEASASLPTAPVAHIVSGTVPVTNPNQQQVVEHTSVPVSEPSVANTTQETAAQPSLEDESAPTVPKSESPAMVTTPSADKEKAQAVETHSRSARNPITRNIRKPAARSITPPKRRAELEQPLSLVEAVPTSVDRPQIYEAPVAFAYPNVSGLNVTGKVALKAVVGSDGRVKQVIALSGNPALAHAAEEAIRQWRYRPYQLLGHPVDAEARIAINFGGRDAVSLSFGSAR